MTVHQDLLGVPKEVFMIGINLPKLAIKTIYVKSVELQFRQTQVLVLLGVLTEVFMIGGNCNKKL
jgi:hypothetical protein